MKKIFFGLSIFLISASAWAGSIANITCDFKPTPNSANNYYTGDLNFVVDLNSTDVKVKCVKAYDGYCLSGDEDGDISSWQLKPVIVLDGLDKQVNLNDDKSLLLTIIGNNHDDMTYLANIVVSFTRTLRSKTPTPTAIATVMVFEDFNSLVERVSDVSCKVQIQ